MANLTPPQCPFLGADGRPAREWQHWLSSMSREVSMWRDDGDIPTAPSASSEVTELRKRVEALELALCMRGDLSPAPRRPING